MVLSYQASGRSSGSACVGQRAGRLRACCGHGGAVGAHRSDSCPLTCPCSGWGAVKSSAVLNLNSYWVFALQCYTLQYTVCLNHNQKGRRVTCWSIIHIQQLKLKNNPDVEQTSCSTARQYKSGHK